MIICFFLKSAQFGAPIIHLGSKMCNVALRLITLNMSQRLVCIIYCKV